MTVKISAQGYEDAIEDSAREMALDQFDRQQDAVRRGITRQNIADRIADFLPDDPEVEKYRRGDDVYLSLYKKLLSHSDTDKFLLSRALRKDMEILSDIDRSGAAKSKDEMVAVYMAGLDKLIGNANKQASDLAKDINAAVKRVRNWGGSSVSGKINFEKDNLFDDEGDREHSFDVTVGTGRMAPGFMVWKDGGSYKVDDVLEAGDTDFFRDPQLQADYFALIGELRNPGSTSRRGRDLRLYTARPAKDRKRYDGARDVPVGIFLTNNPDRAYGLSTDLGGGKRDLWTMVVNERDLVLTLDAGRIKDYQVVGRRKTAPAKKVELISMGEAKVEDRHWMMVALTVDHEWWSWATADIYGVAKDPHVTVIYMPDISPAEATVIEPIVAEVAAEVGEIPVKTIKADKFDLSKEDIDEVPFIVRVEVSGELRMLRSKLMRKIEAVRPGIISKKFPIYKPHVTLYYADRASDVPEVVHGEWNATVFTSYKAHREVYFEEVFNGDCGCLVPAALMQFVEGENVVRTCCMEKCGRPASKAIIWADGRGAFIVCSGHVEAGKKLLVKKNGDWAEIVGVRGYDPDASKKKRLLPYEGVSPDVVISSVITEVISQREDYSDMVSVSIFEGSDWEKVPDGYSRRMPDGNATLKKVGKKWVLSYAGAEVQLRQATFPVADRELLKLVGESDAGASMSAVDRIVRSVVMDVVAEAFAGEAISGASESAAGGALSIDAWKSELAVDEHVIEMLMAQSKDFGRWLEGASGKKAWDMEVAIEGDSVKWTAPKNAASIEVFWVPTIALRPTADVTVEVVVGKKSKEKTFRRNRLTKRDLSPDMLFGWARGMLSSGVSEGRIPRENPYVAWSHIFTNPSIRGKFVVAFRHPSDGVHIWVDGSGFVSPRTKRQPIIFETEAEAKEELRYAAEWIGERWGSNFASKHVVESMGGFKGGFYITVDKGYRRKMIGPYRTWEMAAIHSIARKAPNEKDPDWYDVQQYDAGEVESILTDPGSYNLDSARLVRPDRRSIRIHPMWAEKMERLGHDHVDVRKWDDLILLPAYTVFAAKKIGDVLDLVRMDDVIRKEYRRFQ